MWQEVNEIASNHHFECGYPFPFILDGIASEIYGLSIVFIENDYNFVPSGSQVSLQTDRVDNSAETFIMNEIQDIPLEFPVEIIGDDMDLFKQTEVKNWLYGKLGYRKLQICNENYNTFYFNCKLMAQQDIVFGQPNGFRFNVVCDSPLAWEFPRIVKYEFPNRQYYDFLFNNESGDLGNMFPIVEFKTTIGNTNFSLINKSDNNRTFTFSAIQGNETIIVDNKNKIITSSTGLQRLQNFNKKFFYFIRGVNEVQAVGTCEYLKITYVNARRLGGAVF